MNYNKKEWVRPTPEQIGELVTELGGRKNVARLLRFSDTAIKKGSITVGRWITGSTKIPPACWAVMVAKSKGYDTDSFFDV